MAMVAAACGSDSEGDTDSETTTTAAADETTTTEAGDDEDPGDGGDDEGASNGDFPDTDSTDGVLTIGTLIPLTGDLEFLAPPEVAASRLAVQDINDAGGVLGNDVVLIEADSGDLNVDIANPSVDSLLDQNVDAIIGAASSAVSMLVIDKITSNNVIQFSMANTSAQFTTYDDNGLYFRTAPSDVLQSRVLAQLVAEDGHTTASVIFRQEAYGEGLAEGFRTAYEELGGEVLEFVPYTPDAENFDAEVDRLVTADADATVVVSFEEHANIINTMHQRGIGPNDKGVYGVDGFIGDAGAEFPDRSILEGLRGTNPSVDLSTITELTDRFPEAYGGPVPDFSYGAETYDAIIITALAAVIAGTDNPLAIAAEINGVTKDGEKCTTFADCVAIIEAGGDIDYDGYGGPYEFVDAGEPAAASYRVITYGADGPDVAQDRYVFAE